MKTYKPYYGDLWGNPEDGYDLNDWIPFSIPHVIELPDELPESDKQLVKLLIKSGLLNKEVLNETYYSINVDSDGPVKQIFIDFYYEDTGEQSKLMLVEHNTPKGWDYVES